MTDAFGAPKLERPAADLPAAEADGAIKKLTVVPPSSHSLRDPRPVTNLGKVFGQFAELQQQIAEHVGALEDSVYHQKQEIAAAVAQLPELRERINWLIASFYEQSKKDEAIRERLGSQDTRLEGVANSVRILELRQAQWESAFDDIIAGLLRAKAAFAPDAK